jgi:hypothetical protein
LDRGTLLFVYPMVAKGGSQRMITAENFPVTAHLKHFYAHLRANRQILPIEKYNTANMRIWPTAVLEQIQNGSEAWQTAVPEAVAEEIKVRGLFGYRRGR